MLFHGTNGYTNVPRCHVIRTLLSCSPLVSVVLFCVKSKQLVSGPCNLVVSMAVVVPVMNFKLKKKRSVEFY